jgi:hypothetical protein
MVAVNLPFSSFAFDASSLKTNKGFSPKPKREKDKIEKTNSTNRNLFIIPPFFLSSTGKNFTTEYPIRKYSSNGADTDLPAETSVQAGVI